jgi:hypothetical protein
MENNHQKICDLIRKKNNNKNKNKKKKKNWER